MKALVIRGKEQMALEDAPEPELRPGQVMIAPTYVGICGSDIHYYFNGANGPCVIRGPFIAGHEFCGTLVADEELGGRRYPRGTRVAVHPATWGEPVAGIEDMREIWPGGSYYGSAARFPHCDGAMRERMAVDADQIRILPDGVSMRVGSLAEPLAVVLHGIAQAPDVAGKRVFISGAGPIGLLAVVSCALKGAAVVAVADMLPGPLERACALGATETIEVGAGRPVPCSAYDIVLECSGAASAITTAFDAVDLGGTIIQIGMGADEARPVNLAPVSTKEVTYKGSLRFDTEFDEAIRMLADHDAIAQVITQCYPATRAVEAFKMARDSQGSGKVVISFEDLS